MVQRESNRIFLAFDLRALPTESGFIFIIATLSTPAAASISDRRRDRCAKHLVSLGWMFSQQVCAQDGKARPLCSLYNTEYAHNNTEIAYMMKVGVIVMTISVVILMRVMNIRHVSGWSRWRSACLMGLNAFTGEYLQF